MTKEEFIELINTLNFEELRCATISYYKKKPSKYSYGDEDINPKTICIGTNLESLINENARYSNDRDQQLMREIDNLRSEINKGV